MMSPHKTHLLRGAMVIGIFLLGWGFGTWTSRRQQASSVSLPESLRISTSTYPFVRPLLACNINDEVPGTRQAEQLATTINSFISRAVASGTINIASAYFRNLSTGEWAAVNENEKYYPASLSKVPVMMAYFKLAEKNPSLLNEKILFPGAQSLSDEEIAPRERLQIGTSYTVQELIRRMIVYSDNDAFWLLAERLDPEYIGEIFSDLAIPFSNETISSPSNYMTARSYAFFFRILRNATYTTWNFSEQALEYLSQVDFKDGIVAGVPSGVQVAHKYGLLTLAQNGQSLRQLHDCGIVYAEKGPYVICVMTKSHADLPALEGVISNISNIVYTYVNNPPKP